MAGVTWAYTSAVVASVVWPRGPGHDAHVLPSLEHEGRKGVAEIMKPLAGESEAGQVALEGTGHVDAVQWHLECDDGSEADRSIQTTYVRKGSGWIPTGWMCQSCDRYWPRTFAPIVDADDVPMAWQSWLARELDDERKRGLFLAEVDRLQTRGKITTFWAEKMRGLVSAEARTVDDYPGDPPEVLAG
ncbi:MAG TPA: hypothetical protein VGA91_04645 [Candidatus Limnocylindria bacterium]